MKAVVARVLAEAMFPKAQADKQVLMEEVKFYSVSQALIADQSLKKTASKRRLIS